MVSGHIAYKQSKAKERCDMCGSGYASSMSLFAGGVYRICAPCVRKCMLMLVDARLIREGYSVNE